MTLYFSSRVKMAAALKGKGNKIAHTYKSVCFRIITLIQNVMKVGKVRGRHREIDG